MVLTIIVTELLGVLNPSEAQEIATSITPQILGALLLLAFSGSWLWSASKAHNIQNTTFSAFWTHPDCLRSSNETTSRNSSKQSANRWNFWALASKTDGICRPILKQRYSRHCGRWIRKSEGRTDVTAGRYSNLYRVGPPYVNNKTGKSTAICSSKSTVSIATSNFIQSAFLPSVERLSLNDTDGYYWAQFRCLFGILVGLERTRMADYGWCHHL